MSAVVDQTLAAQLNDAAPDRSARREENGRFSSSDKSFKTLILAPMDDRRAAIRVAAKIPAGFKVVGMRKGVVEVGKRGAATMCAAMVDGATSCERMRFFKRPKTLAKACMDGSLDCDNIAFLKEQKRIHNPEKGSTRRYGSFVINKNSRHASAEATVGPAEIIRLEQMHNKRSSDDNAFLFTIKQKARRGNEEAKDILEYEKEKNDDAPIETIASRATNHDKLSVKGLERLHDLHRALSLIRIN
jgi:hypothetical protein